ACCLRWQKLGSSPARERLATTRKRVCAALIRARARESNIGWKLGRAEPPCYRRRMSDGTLLSPAERWRLVNDRLRAEARTASYEKKLVQLASLMASVDDF